MKKYRLKQSIIAPFGCVREGTVGIKEGDFHCFPYEGKEKSRLNGWLGNAFMTYDPRDFPDFFEEIKETTERRTVSITRQKHGDPRIKPLEIIVTPSNGIAEWELSLLKGVIEDALNIGNYEEQVKIAAEQYLNTPILCEDCGGLGKHNPDCYAENLKHK